jgi:hypothetical protein
MWRCSARAAQGAPLSTLLRRRKQQVKSRTDTGKAPHRAGTIGIAAVAMSALFVAPVSAERLQGGPIKQNGQCWKSHSAGSEATWAPGVPARRRQPRLPSLVRLAVGPEPLSRQRGVQTSARAPRSLWGPFCNGTGVRGVKRGREWEGSVRNCNARWEAGMLLRTAPEDIEAICGYLLTKPAGASPSDVANHKSLDGPRVSALKSWGLIEDAAGRLTLSPRGRLLATHGGAQKARALRELLLASAALRSP